MSPTTSQLRRVVRRPRQGRSAANWRAILLASVLQRELVPGNTVENRSRHLRRSTQLIGLHHRRNHSNSGRTLLRHLAAETVIHFSYCFYWQSVHRRLSWIMFLLIRARKVAMRREPSKLYGTLAQTKLGDLVSCSIDRRPDKRLFSSV